MYPFNTLQVCYRHIEDTHEDVCYAKKYLFFLQIYQWSPDARSSILDLVNFDR